MNWQRLLHDHISPPIDRPIQHCFTSNTSTNQSIRIKHGDTVRVLTLNAWGLPIVPHCTERTQSISKLLHSYDIICLQECLHLNEVNVIIKQAISDGLLYCIQFIQGIGYPVYNSVVASGLVILSRYSIIYMNYTRYTVNGYIDMLQHSDYYLAKGIAHIRIQLANNIIGDIYTTHTHANYSGSVYDVSQQYNTNQYIQQVKQLQSYHNNSNISLIEYPYDDIYLSHRIVQLYQMANYINSTRSDTSNTNNIVIVAADLNCVPNDISLQLLLRMTRLDDTMHNSAEHTYGCIHNTFSPLFISTTVPDQNTRLHRVHSANDDRLDNSNGKKNIGHDGSICDVPTRIDYILYSKSNSIEFDSCSILRAHTYIDSVQQNISISDHHGVQAIFKYIDHNTIDSGHNQHDNNFTNTTLPLLSHILQCSILILWYGYIHGMNRRNRHWYNVFYLAAILILLYVVQYTSILQLSIVLTVHTIPISISRHTLFNILYTYSTVLIECSKLFSLLCMALQLYLTQYTVREETQALRQVMQEMTVYYNNLSLSGTE